MSAFGLYIHIPYCQRICPYCDFNVSLNRKSNSSQWSNYFQALEGEWHSRRRLASGAIRSIYFGGGTPSLAPPERIESLLGTFRQSVEFEPDLEITLEADPGTIDLESLQKLRDIGVNRLSLGWQSTTESLLKVIGRGHTARDNFRMFKMARKAGFDNISVDFMFGLPGQTMEMLNSQIDCVLDSGPEHISLYALTYHEGTPFERWRKSGRLIALGDDLETEMMLQIESRLESAGFEHYEVSNYARPGFRSKHNHAYWTGVPYLGVGAGAHSFTRKGWELGIRFEALRDIKHYIDYWGSEKTEPPELEVSTEWLEKLTSVQLAQESLMVGLRTQEGVKLTRFEADMLRNWILPGVEKALKNEWVVVQDDCVRPTPLGMQFADSLGALFF